MIVVSDTSPLTNLAAIGHFELLRVLFSEIHIPEAVFLELSAGGIEWPGYREVSQLTWVRRNKVDDQTLVNALRLDLDRGEAETIVLALQLGADLVLMDEQAGRLAAQHLGLKTMGVIGMIVRAKQKGHLPAIRPLLDGLREIAGFYIDQRLYNRALELSSEL